MKFKKFLFTIIFALVLIFGSALKISAEENEEDEPQSSFEVVKSDDMEYLEVPTDTAQATADYIWRNTQLFWAEGNTVKETTDPDKVLSGSKSLNWTPGAGDSEGWTPTEVNIGISPGKTMGTEGGYLLRLEFLVKLHDVERFVVKVWDTSNAVIHEMVLAGDYGIASDDKTLDKDPETEIIVEKKSTTESGAAVEHARVCFTVRSSIKLTTYYSFSVKSLSENASIILDDVVFSKDTASEIKQRFYEEFKVEGFEASDLSQTMFTGAQESVKEVSLNTEKPIMETKDLRIVPSARNKGVYIRSEVFTLEETYYKLFYKFKGEYVTKAGVYVRNAETDAIIYDLIVNPITEERLPEVSNPLFDSSKLSRDSKFIYTSYGEFGSKKAQNVYLELYFSVSNVNGYISFDDINVMKEYIPSYPDSYEPNDPDRVEGNLSAEYKDLEGTFTEYTPKSSGSGCAGSVVASVVGVLALLGILILAKKGMLKHSVKKTLNSIMILLLVGFITVAMTSCDSDSSSDRIDGDYYVVTPEKIDGKLDNPGMGWVMLEEPTYGGHVDIGASGEFPEVDNISLSTSWASIEYEEGVFDFSNLDRTIDYWTSVGKHINLRICTDNLVLTYTYKGVPDWLLKKYNVNYTMVDYMDPGPVSVCQSIDVRDKTYLKFLDRFLEALHNHYADNKMVDFVEIRGFGLWGEWHHGWTFDSKEQRMASLDNILSYYYEQFKDSGKFMCVCSSWDPDYTTTNEYYIDNATADEAYMNYVNWSSFDTAWRTPGISFRRDSGGALLRYDLDERIMAEAFRSGKRLPLLGEYSTNFTNLTTPANAFDLISAIDDILYKMRPNYSTVLNWVAVDLANIIDSGNTEFIDRANKMFGYRLAVDTAYTPKQVASGSAMEVMTTWSNTAVGVFPYKAGLNYHFLDENNNIVHTLKDDNFDARLFIQGEINNFYSELSVPESLADGKYKLAVSIDVDGEKIALGMAGETAEDSRIYVLSNIEVNSKANTKPLGEALFVQKHSYENKDELQFEANSIYEITFKYLPGFDMANFYFGTNDHYEFSLVSESAAADDVTKKVGTYRWQDISGEVGQKTVVVSTGNHSDYKLNVESINFDKIYVDEVWVRKVGGASENFEKYEVTDASTIIEPMNLTSAEVAEDSIDGRGLEMMSGNTNQKYVLSKIDVKNFKFEKGYTYNITFDFRNLGQVGNGGYFFVANGDYNNVRTDYTVFGEWYERADNWDTKKTFSFTPTEDNQTIVFGVNASGSYMIDNLIITKQKTSAYVEGTDLGYEHNVRPDWTDIGMGKLETFERGAFQSCGFNWGQFAWGRMTSKEEEVPNYSEDNKTALLLRIEEEAYNPAVGNEWFEFARSKREYYPFKSEGYYKVSFDYMIIKEGTYGQVFMFFRDDTIGDRFTEAVNGPIASPTPGQSLTNGREVGVVYHYEGVWKMKAHDNYQFMFSAHGLWEFSVDNILIEELTEEEALAYKAQIES